MVPFEVKLILFAWFITNMSKQKKSSKVFTAITNDNIHCGHMSLGLGDHVD